MVEQAAEVGPLRWRDLSDELREALKEKLTGLWGSTGDEEVFDSLAIDKQQALLLILSRLRDKGLWHFVKHVNNVYGEDGVGISTRKAGLKQRSISCVWSRPHRSGTFTSIFTVRCIR